MILSDGFLDMPSFTEAEIVTESLTWDNTGLIGIVCDDPATAVANLGADIILENGNNSRDVRVYNANTSEISYLIIGGFNLTPYTDKIFDYSWNPADIVQNQLDLISFELTLKRSQDDGYVAVFFIQINEGIYSLDKDASELVLDYTYLCPFGYSNLRYKDLKRNSSRFYIYNQDNDTIYDFKTFS